MEKARNKLYSSRNCAANSELTYGTIISFSKEEKLIFFFEDQQLLAISFALAGRKADIMYAPDVRFGETSAMRKKSSKELSTT